MLEGEAADVPDYGDAGDLSLHLAGHQLEEDVGRGVELLHGDGVGVPPPCGRVTAVIELLHITEFTVRLFSQKCRSMAKVGQQNRKRKFFPNN